MSEVDPNEVLKRHTRAHYGDPAVSNEHWVCRKCSSALSDPPKEWPCDAVLLAGKIERLRAVLPKIWDAGFSFACQQSCAGTNDSDKTDYRARDISAILHPETKEKAK